MRTNDFDAAERAMHVPSGRWRIGLLLAVITVLLWCTMPIALSLLLVSMDAITITWYRFVVATVVLAALLRAKGALPAMAKLRNGNTVLLVAVAAVGLTGGFILFVLSLTYIPPGASIVVYQLAPFFVLLGGVVVFKESFRRPQWIGAIALFAGLVLFFNQRIRAFDFRHWDYWFGVFLVLIASFVWASYALAQKQLLRVYSPGSIMLLLYAAGVLLMLPFCSPSQVLQFSAEQYLVFAYACLNMLIGYGCFAQALEHWEASRVSAVTATNPLLVLAVAHVAGFIWPGRIMRDEWNVIGLVGAILVVVGAALTALGGRKSEKRTLAANLPIRVVRDGTVAVNVEDSAHEIDDQLNNADDNQQSEK